MSIELFTATPSATIYYTTDGSTPTTGSTLYSGPITLSGYGTVKAIAVLGGRPDSEVLTAAYIQPSGQIYTVETPEASPVGGGYPTANFPLTVSLSTGTPNSSIYYTTDGSEPSIDSTLYTVPITGVADTDIIRAIAVREGWNDSEILDSTYYAI